jgi:hypothetical protein
MLSPRSSDVGFLHRSLTNSEVYFVANTGNTRVKADAKFRVSGLNAEWWDPITGKARPALIAERDANSTTLAVELEPYESRVIVFTRASEESPGADRAVETRQEELRAIDLSENWQLSLRGAARTLNRLRSWTDDEDSRYYSGLGTYERSFVLPDDMFRSGTRLNLDFGESSPAAETTQDPRAHGIRAKIDARVREAAVVWVNEKRAGSVWCSPWRLDVTDFLKSGENRLRIVVGNTAINHMAGRALPDYRLLNLRYGERFQPQDMDKVQPVASGLLGPIRLVARDASRQ